MNTFNNFSPLAFREKSMKATYKKWYAYGKEFALPFSTTELPPFQFTVTNLPSFDPTTVEVFLVNEATGERTGTGIKIKVDTMDEHNSVLYVSPGSNVYAKSIEPGVYRAEFTIPGGETYVSTPICVTEGIETNTNFVKLEYWNDEKLAYPNGFVTTGTDNDFKFQMYIPTTFFKPKYEFEEEITKRAGYKFLELQTCNKVFGFNFLAPEYICDALRLVRLSDYIRFTHDGEYYNALNFEYNPDWQDNGYLAAIECQFETDTIIQKLPSFNRRDRESFYNALLADIDTPILFSPDTVGLYYREFKQGEPTIKGKLIRELSPIDLIDENTTIAVDMGAGEARKFNLYRMLEGYISKNHEDVTEFLLSLRGGVNIGTPNTSGEYPASVDRDGNAKLGNVDGGKSRFDSVETGFLTVNNTSATIDGMGNANVNDLTARGDSILRSDVYTGSKNGSHTGKITKEGQLQYLSAIIYEFLSSETFVPGFLGEGFKIWLENGNWNIECDNLTVRQTMNIFELLIQKIRSVNGAIVVSQSNGKVTAVEDAGTQYKITFGEEFPTFQEGDLIRCQSWSKNVLKFYWVEVKTAADGYILCDKSEFNNVVPAVGDEVVQMGNTKNPERQALIYITAQESGHPYIEILNGVKTKSLSGTNRTRLGDLSNIQDSAFPEGQQPSGSGLYCDNAFLRGIFLLRNGKSVEDEVNQAKQDAANAATEAERAQQTAQEAKDRLNKWADDGFISPTEKPALIDEGKRIQAEYLQIKANADKYGVPVTEYTEAYNNYLNELRYHSAATPEDIAVRPELAQSQTAYYDKRNGALNAISNAAKSYVDEAEKKLKEYLDTEITAIPGKIELAVRSLKTADTNLLKGAFREITNASYNIGYYNYDVPVINGKEYTLTVCYTLSSENTHISAYSNRGTNFLVDFNTKGNMVVESKKVTMVGYKPTEGLYFFQFPNGTYGSKVHWAVLTDGNLGVTSWIPAASEKNVGLKNLCSFKRIVDAGFTYASRYDDDGTILMLPSVLHKESFVAKKDMFGLTYDPQKRYYVFIDHFVPSATIPNGTRSISLRIEYTDGTSEYMAVYNDSIGNNFILTSKAIRYILGSYHTPISTYLRIGIFETSFPVSWSPAPEDQLYKSVKYTDTQILAVDGKIELSVTTQLNKRVIGGANLCLKSGVCITGVGNHFRINMSKYWRDLRGKKVTLSFDYEYSNLVLGRNSRIGMEEAVLKDGTSNHYYIGSWKYFDSTSLKADTGRFVETVTVPNDIVNAQNIGISFYIQVGDGTTMKICNPQIEIGDTATGWKPAPEDGVNESKEYTRQQISIVEGKITTTVEKITEVDGKVTGLASRVTQTESSINSVVERVDDQGNRLSAAEIKLDSTSIKLGVVEGTANDAKATAGTASNKADAVDGRVTATQNGLVETGINITSRKIVLKSDNVLFQNNAGQQTAALNANGRLTANVIEAGEVVANGFAAQRITTGNLTVTDGAVIAGMSISGNRLTGGNITLTNGARIGSFQVSLNWLTGLNSSQIDLWSGANTGEGNNTLMQPGRILINQKGDNQPALEIQGKGNTLIAGKYCSLNVDTFQVTANQVRIPGVFFACSLLANATIGKTWGSFNFHITGFRKLSTGRYTVTYTGYTGDVYIMLQPMEYTKWGCACIEPYSQGSFTYKTFDANSGLFDCAVIAYFCGMPS
jgi:cytoskeletal protein CcmA (bactofilin family)